MNESVRIELEKSRISRDYTRYETLRQELWGDPEDNLASGRNLMSEGVTNHGSTVILGAFLGKRLIGFAHGYFGFKDWRTGFRDRANIVFYSQYLGVKEGYRRAGVGYALKRAQGEVVASFGVDSIRATFDPLMVAAAAFNLRKLGSDVVSYEENLYPGFGGRLNHPSIPTDRFLVSWNIKNRRKPRRKVIPNALLANVPYKVSEEVSGLPEKIMSLDLKMESHSIFVRIPHNYESIINRSQALAKAWRLKTRRVFNTYFENGYRIIGFVNDRSGASYYELKRASLNC